MRCETFDMAALMYPSATILDRMEFDGNHNVLLSTPDEVERVWNWYARRLGMGSSVASLGFPGERGVNPRTCRRTLRLLSEEEPFTPSEHPQLMVARQGPQTLTVLISRREDNTTRIVVVSLMDTLASTLPSPEEFAVDSAHSAAETLQEAGYIADFSMASLKEVDRVIEEHSHEGRATTGGYFDPKHLPEDNRTAVRLFGLGCYVGEVLKRQYGGDWCAESADLQEAIDSLRLRLPSGTVVDPIGKVFKRLKNGPEDSVEMFGHLLKIFADTDAIEKPTKAKKNANTKRATRKKKEGS